MAYTKLVPLLLVCLVIAIFQSIEGRHVYGKSYSSHPRTRQLAAFAAKKLQALREKSSSNARSNRDTQSIRQRDTNNNHQATQQRTNNQHMPAHGPRAQSKARQGVSHTSDVIQQMCPFRETINCQEHIQFRTANGSCSNLQHPLWGMSFRALDRFLTPDYADGIGEPRRAKSGAELPSARAVSRSLFWEEDRPSSVMTLLSMTFGQFLDHDITRTALSTMTTATGEHVAITCGDNGCETDGEENEACFPIELDQTGSTEEDFVNKDCLMFVRSEAGVQDDCSVGSREQINEITPVLDCSGVYGNTDEEQAALRDPDRSRGKMLLTTNPLNPSGKGLLPTYDNGDGACMDTDDTYQCFTAGDNRANVQPGLTAMHTIWQRYHNVIEARLHDIRPRWRGERLFQETRRIVIAIWQHIVFNEYLPLTLGTQAMDQYDLTLRPSGYFHGHDSDISPDIANGFATAAFRFGHSKINSFVRFASQTYDDFEEEKLRNFFVRPHQMYSMDRPGGTGVDSVMLGQVSAPAQQTDGYFTDEITKHLFTEHPPNGVSEDLIALNIQRGRDHGIPAYIDWCEWCGLGRAARFSDLPSHANATVPDTLSSLFESVEDIDLYPGAITEDPVPGGSVGPTFSCIIGRQFRRLKFGDRFWYESGDPDIRFTPEQLAAIRNMTLSRVICDTLDEISTIQKYPLLQPLSKVLESVGEDNIVEASELLRVYLFDDPNERRPCSQIPQLDITLWAE